MKNAVKKMIIKENNTGTISNVSFKDIDIISEDDKADLEATSKHMNRAQKRVYYKKVFRLIKKSTGKTGASFQALLKEALKGTEK